MAFQFLPSGGGTALYSGVFIPVSDLANGGLQSAAELGESVAQNLKRDKSILAILEVLTAYIASLTSDLVLGIGVTRPSIQSLTWSYTLNFQAFELNSGSTPLRPLPVPVSGTNSGKGDIGLNEIFPNVSKVANGATIAASGVLIESAPLVRYAAPAHADLTVSGDNRSWFNALFRWIANDNTSAPLRSLTVPSAIIAKTPSTPAIFNLPSAATATPNPTTAINASDLDVLVPVSFQTQITIQLALAPLSSQAYEVNSVTG